MLVATNATYAPNEFVRPNGRVIVGMDPELARALASVLGLRAEIVNVRYDTIIWGWPPASTTSACRRSRTRRRERVVDFVTYFSTGTSFFVKANSGPPVNSLADLCGRTVAVVRGTTEAADAEAQTAACRRARKPDVKVAEFGDHNGAYIALESSDDAVGMADSPVARYLVERSNGQLALSGKPYNEAPYGIALPKGSGMAKPILAALKKLMADGTYRTILTRWGNQKGAIASPKINGAIG